MEKHIQEKFDRLTELAKKSKGNARRPITPAKPDSLATVIRTRQDGILFQAQLDALTELARQERLESEQHKKARK